MCRPKPTLRLPRAAENLLDCKNFPRRTVSRTAQQSTFIAHTEQRMQQTCISKVDFGRLHLSFCDIHEPRLKLANQKCTCKKIEITAHGFIRCAQRPAEFGCVTGLTVPVGEHSLKTAHCNCGYTNSELRDVALKKGTDEVLAPR